MNKHFQPFLFAVLVVAVLADFNNNHRPEKAEVNKIILVVKNG